MLSQVLAILIFVGMFVSIVTVSVERYIPTLIASLLMIFLVFMGTMHSMEAVAEAVDLSSVFQRSFWYPGHSEAVVGTGINWSTIIFIAGMMIMVEGMEDAGFFRWLCLKLAKMVNYHIIPLFIGFMIMSAVLSMFIDSITVILFLAAVSIELSQLLEFDPIPFVIAQIFTANLGGAATMSGDPPNIIIGTSLGLTFGQFVQNTGVIAWIAMLFIVPFFYLCFHKNLKASERARNKTAVYPSPREAITSRAYFTWSTMVFSLTVILLVTHAQTGLSVATVGMISAVLTLMISMNGIWSVLKRLDWKTLAFFMGLFVVVSGLEQTKVLDKIATFISGVSGGNVSIMIIMILWLSAIASAFVDNIPLAATMVPVISSIAATQGVALNTLAWTLSLATDIGGSATPIGASANVVGTAISAKQGKPITWRKYCKYSVPATMIVLVISMICIFNRYL